MGETAIAEASGVDGMALAASAQALSVTMATNCQMVAIRFHRSHATSDKPWFCLPPAS